MFCSREAPASGRIAEYTMRATCWRVAMAQKMLWRGRVSIRIQRSIHDSRMSEGDPTLTRHMLLVALATVASFETSSFSRAESGATEAKSSQVIYLHAGRDFEFHNAGKSIELPLLGRELARQALLIAAREELSCATRDEHLGQTLPKADCIELDLLGVKGKDSRFVLMKISPNETEAVGMEDYKTLEGMRVSPLVATFERFSRNEFVAHLRAAGVNGEPRPWNEAAVVPAKVEQLMREMNFVSQWDAACRLHSVINRDGPSPNTISALSMAYANLGLLTEYHWNTAHNVFTARSLLYAQRLVISKRSPKQALLTRAYAYSLAGVFPAAVGDIENVKKTASEDPSDRGDKLDLTELLDAYCHFAVDDLKPEKFKSSQFEVANLLQFLLYDFSLDSDHREEVGLEAIERMPHCYRIASSLATDPGLGLGHVATEKAYTMTVKTLYDRLAVIEGIPSEALAILKQLNPKKKQSKRFRSAPGFMRKPDYQLRAELIELLAGFDKPIYSQEELGWSDLASLIAEHSFQEIFLNAWFVTDGLGSTADDLLDDAEPLYQKHPFAPLMVWMRADRSLSDAALKDVASIDLDTLEFQTIYLYRSKESAHNAVASWNQLNRIFEKRADMTINDLSRKIALISDYQPSFDFLRDLCPEHPLALTGVVKFHWDEVEKYKDVWLKRGEKIPDLLTAIGQKYEANKNYDKALETLERACEIKPSSSRYRALAGVYEKKKKWDEWLDTMDKALTFPDSGLEHSSIKQEIAEYHFQNRRFEEALPFAEAAAESYSASGLLCAAQCHEALQQWDEAEAYYRAVSQRYSRTYWFSFTKRTGQGDELAATRSAETVLMNPERESNSLDANFYFTLFSGDVDTAIQLIKNNWTEGDEVLYNGLFYAMLLVETKKTDKAISVLQETRHILEKPEGGRKLVKTPPIRDLVRLIETDLVAGGSAKFPEGAIEKARNRFEAGDNLASFDYFIGRYHELQGKKEEARRFYIECMSFPGEMNQVYRTLAGMRLQAMGEGPTVYREALWTGKIAER
jgi:tetratricopeptide (TPR) repeat protein